MTRRDECRSIARRAFGALLCLILLHAAFAADAVAQARAWLDRDRIGPGETVTLNVETSAPGSPTPDFSPLQRDFVVSGNTSRREFEMRNGRTMVRATYGVALRPRRGGTLTVPAIAVGNARTAPLTLMVTAAASASPDPARAGDDVFIESAADDESPYVQQAVGWVVRLYSAAPLVSGQLDQPAPDGATLQRVGTDAQYTRDIGGRRYMVVERRFQLVPERSGTLTLPAATFEGRGTGGFFDELFGDRGGALGAQARPRFLQVKSPPVNAPQPWLPLHALTLRYRTTPSTLRLGGATDLVVEVTADGATAVQMPDIRLPSVDGAQVFADPAKTDETFNGGRPQVKQVRRFSLVPTREGVIRVPALRIAWWDVGNDRAQVASLPALELRALAPANGNSVGQALPSATPSNSRPRSVGSDVRRGVQARNPWVVATVAFALLWVATLMWRLGHRRGRAAPATPVTGATPTPAGSGRVADPATLRRALDTGSLADVADALVALAPVPCVGIDAVRDALADARQRDAVDLLQRARWADGDGRAARAALRQAFADGPQWRRPAAKGEATLLSPLYPER